MGNKGSFKKTHGMSFSKEYFSWRCMLARCHNPKDVDYSRYGGRGIKVYEEWKHSFELFYKDMGPKPSDKHSLDRIDNEGNYGPSNCKWSTALEQSANRRNNIYLELNGKKMLISHWDCYLGGSRGLVSDRLQSGWTIEKALTTPAKKRKT